jgi:tetratricopeptide (TPR) repeat protein
VYRFLTVALALLVGACTGSRGGGDAAPPGGGGAAAGGDDAAERLYQEGVSWARRAETAPLPTPDPAAPGVRPELKPEELRAMESFEKAIAARPEHAGAHMGLGDLLAPHALRRIEAERQARERQAQEAAARGRSRSRRGRAATPEPTPTPAVISLVDASAERVIREYQAAMQADPGRAPVDRLIAFAVPAGRLDVADAAHQELLQRMKESAEPHILYGDFLVAHKHDSDGAIDQYRQALIWTPQDEATKAKLAEIYLARATELYRSQDYMRAANELREAQRYVTDKNSELGQRVQAYVVKMREIRR